MPGDPEWHQLPRWRIIRSSAGVVRRLVVAAADSSGVFGQDLPPDFPFHSSHLYYWTVRHESGRASRTAVRGPACFRQVSGPLGMPRPYPHRLAGPLDNLTAGAL